MDSIQTPIIDILIVGGGYSAIPLIRELEKDGKDYLIVSEGKPIWEDPVHQNPGEQPLPPRLQGR